MEKKPHSPRTRAVDLLAALSRGEQTVDSCLRSEAGVEENDQALLSEIVYGVVRHRRYLEAVLQAFLKKPLAKLPEPAVFALCIALYQLLFLERIPAYAIIWEAVEEVKHRYGASLAKVANGVLRSVERDSERWCWQPAIAASPFSNLAIHYSFPDWLVDRWRAQVGEGELAALLSFLAERPDQAVRVNRLKMTRDEVKAALEAEGYPSAIPPDQSEALVLCDRKLSRAHPLYEQGALSFQSLSSQCVAAFVSRLLHPGAAFFDACAGVGGKVFAIAETWGERCGYTAYDPKAEALETLEREKTRLGLPWVETLSSAEAAALPPRWDVVLVDAPCSGLGTVQKHPELKWRRHEPELARFGDRQAAILGRYAQAVKPGGALVYSVCSTEPEEDGAVITAFLATHPGFETLRPEGGVHEAGVWTEAEGGWRLYPHRVRSEGFFVACLRRKG